MGEVPMNQERRDSVASRQLMRRLHGELSKDEERRLDERLARDPEARVELARLEATWRALESPPPGAPESFVAEVLERVERDRGAAAAWPAPARLVAPAVVAAGILGGVWLGRWAAGVETALPLGSPSMAESYVELLAGPEPALEEPRATEGER